MEIYNIRNYYSVMEALIWLRNIVSNDIMSQKRDAQSTDTVNATLHFTFLH